MAVIKVVSYSGGGMRKLDCIALQRDRSWVIIAKLFYDVWCQSISVCANLKVCVSEYPHQIQVSPYG